jgi:transposase
MPQREAKIDVEKFKQLYSQGLVYREIAKQLGVPEETVKYWRKKLNLPKRFGKPRKVDLERLKQLCEQMLPSKIIAKQLGISEVTVHKYRQKLNLPRSPRGKSMREKMERNIERVLSLINKRVYVTVKDVMSEVGVHEYTALKYLRTLENEGKIKRFTFTVRRIGRKYGKTDFVDGWIRGNILVFYSDEKAFLEKLSNIVFIESKGMRKAFTHLLKKNNISDEGIAYFYECYSKKHPLP